MTNVERRRILREVQRIATRVAAGHLTPAEGVRAVRRAVRS